MEKVSSNSSSMPKKLCAERCDLPAAILLPQKSYSPIKGEFIWSWIFRGAPLIKVCSCVTTCLT